MEKVLLIDGDMRRPSVHKFFEKDNILGLSNFLAEGKIKLEDITNKTSYENLEILTSGTKPPDPIFLLSSVYLLLTTVCNFL